MPGRFLRSVRTSTSAIFFLVSKFLVDIDRTVDASIDYSRPRNFQGRGILHKLASRVSEALAAAILQTNTTFK